MKGGFTFVSWTDLYGRLHEDERHEDETAVMRYSTV